LRTADYASWLNLLNRGFNGINLTDDARRNQEFSVSEGVPSKVVEEINNVTLESVPQWRESALIEQCSQINMSGSR